MYALMARNSLYLKTRPNLIEMLDVNNTDASTEIRRMVRFIRTGEPISSSLLVALCMLVRYQDENLDDLLIPPLYKKYLTEIMADINRDTEFVSFTESERICTSLATQIGMGGKWGKGKLPRQGWGAWLRQKWTSFSFWPWSNSSAFQIIR